MAKSIGGVNRKIYYYDLVASIQGPNNTVIEAVNSSDLISQSFTYLKALREQLEEAEPEDRKSILARMSIETESGDKLYLMVDEINEVDNRVKYRLVLCRQDALPYVEKNGVLTAITSEVDGDFNLAEITHCMYFPDKGIIGGEYNFQGARPSALNIYLPKVFNQIALVFCTAKIRNDIFESIVEDETYTLFDVCVKNTAKMRQVLINDMGLIGSFMKDVADYDTLEVVIRRRKGNKKRGFDAPMSKEEMKVFVNNHREDIKKLYVSQGKTSDAIDLLGDKLICSRKFVRTEQKTIDGKEVYAAINNFYDTTVKNS